MKTLTVRLCLAIALAISPLVAVVHHVNAATTTSTTPTTPTDPTTNSLPGSGFPCPPCAGATTDTQ